MLQRINLLFILIIAGTVTVYGSFLQNQKTRQPDFFHHFKTYTRQSSGVWNSLVTNEAHKWRHSWQGSEKNGKECSVVLPQSGRKIVHGFPPASYSNPLSDTDRYGGKGIIEFSPLENTQSVPEPPLHVLIAISLLWIPFNRWNRKGAPKDKNK